MTIISDNYKFIFIHIPKCGGSSIEREFERFCKWGDFVIGSTKLGFQLQKTTYKLYGLGKHSKPKELELIFGKKWEEYLKVTIIRHPRKIIESYYKFGKRREKEICTNKGVTRDVLLNHISKQSKKLIPEWMFVQNRGVMIDAIVSENFNDYLKAVSDTRWIDFFEDYVLNTNIDCILKLEESKEITDFFKKLVSSDFNLLHENSSKSEKLVWSEENLDIFNDLISETCSKLGYDFSAI